MSNSNSEDSDGDYYGPALPPDMTIPSAQKVIGPALPPGLKASHSSVSDDTDTPIDLSSSLKKGNNESISQIGPALPPGFKSISFSAEAVQVQNISKTDNSTPAENNSNESGSDSDSDMIGPFPPDDPRALKAAARRNMDSSSNNDKPRKKLQREEWMLIPPSNKNVTELGLGPRKFLARAPEQPVLEGDDAEQIDSDEEFERRTRAEMDQQIIDEYDKKMEDLKGKVEVGKRKSGSLLEIHQRELKEKKAKTSEPKERRPFDRNTDLSVTGLSGEDKHKYIEKSRELNTRFQKGRQKFL